MRVTAEMKAKVKAKLVECIEIANDNYDHTFRMPTVLYTKRGTTAGTAHDGRYEINLNAVLLMENKEVFINRTVVHEFAHLVDGIVNPHTRETSLTYTRTGRLKRTKRDVHGPSWKRIMRLLGAEPSRCHSYDTTNSKVKKSGGVKHVWKCACGNATMELGPKRHKKQLAATARTGYYLRGHTVRRCGGYSYFGIKGQELQPMPLAADAPAPKPKRRTGGSKLDACRRVFNPSLGKSGNIAHFIAAGCTPAGAMTYYYKISKEVG